MFFLYYPGFMQVSGRPDFDSDRPKKCPVNDRAVINYNRKALSPIHDFYFDSMSVNHYENFPVASLLLPRRLRPAVRAIYHFARSADDIADEGNADIAERLAGLAHYRQGLDRIEQGLPADEPLFAALQAAVSEHSLSVAPLRDLLSAFEQDVCTTRYADFAGVLDYCARSANPVGRLMLALYGRLEPRLVQQSDAICTALQLTNFLQDVAIDLQKNRIYLPQEDLQRFDVREQQLFDGRLDSGWRALMQFEIARTRSMMLAGAPLAIQLPGRIGWELRLVVQGGLRILERIETAGYDVFRHRPALRKKDWGTMFWRALRMPA